MHDTRNDLPVAVRTKVNELLGRRLGDGIDLMLQVKHAHWNVKGASFIALHELFDKLHAGVAEYVDLIAERIVQLGGTADGLAPSVVKRSSLPHYPGSTVDGMDHVPAEPADWTSLADDQVMRAEMRRKLIDALTHLPEVYRVPVLLRDIHGLSTEEASAVLRVKPQTLKSRLHRGRLILRKQLADFAGGLTLHHATA